jgi:hypothetical protein
LRLTDNAWVVIDTSANGLQVRGLSVGRSQPFVLSAGDHIVIGDYELLCESDDDERSNSDTPEPLVANRAADLISPDGEMRFQTNRGTTILTAPMPFAYGRTSVLFRGQGDSSDLCVKLFPNVATEELRSFNAETRVQMALTHPNILKVLDVGVQTMSAGGPFVVLPFCAGGSFRDCYTSDRSIRSRRLCPCWRSWPQQSTMRIALASSMATSSLKTLCYRTIASRRF